MNKLHYRIEINSLADKVWNALWEKDNYSKWTKVFNNDSFIRTDWKAGSKIHFLNSEGKGMYSLITKCVENESMHFTHLGEIVNFEEQPIEDEKNDRNKSKENYNLVANKKKTMLYVVLELDLTKEIEKYFNNVFPKGLQIVKEIAEG